MSAATHRFTENGRPAAAARRFFGSDVMAAASASAKDYASADGRERGGCRRCCRRDAGRRWRRQPQQPRQRRQRSGARRRFRHGVALAARAVRMSADRGGTTKAAVNSPSSTSWSSCEQKRTGITGTSIIQTSVSSRQGPRRKHVLNTSMCELDVRKRERAAVVITAVDQLFRNLAK